MLPCMQKVDRSDIHLRIRSPEPPMTQLLSCAKRSKLLHTPTSRKKLKARREPAVRIKATFQEGQILSNPFHSRAERKRKEEEEKKRIAESPRL